MDASPAPFRLDGKVAVVTGGASGIGEAISKTFCSAGAVVRIVDVRGDTATATAQAIAKDGGECTAHKCDIADATDVQRTFSTLLAETQVDILVNNAGVSHIGSIEDTSEADFDRLFSVNVRGAYHCIRAVIGAMKARQHGVILNIASIASHAGLANRFAYSMSKGAILAMTYSVARDYVNHGIRCVSISPARVHTPFVDGYLARHYPGRESELFAQLSALQPIGRMGTPRDVADLARYLCSDEAGFATGADYPLDGGFLNLHG